jgi:predicted MFS family arabinose efflux permease
VTVAGSSEPRGTSSTDALDVPTERAIRLLSIATGSAVATVYLAQPLSGDIAATFGVPAAAASVVAIGAQAGYGAGMLLLLPAGDATERRRLATVLMAAMAAFLGLAALAPSLGMLALLAVAAGATAAVAHLLAAIAASMVGDERRGHVMGRVMGGLLVGILLARTASGLLAQVGGWRAPFAAAAVVALCLAAAFARVLPRQPPATTLRYRELLASLHGLVREQRVLRYRMAYHALGMVGFGAMWTTLTLLLIAPPFAYDPATIGLCGLLGVAGVVGASRIGRLADRHSNSALTLAFLVTVLAGWLVLLASSASILGLSVGIVLVDLGVQGCNVVSQRLIHTGRPDARSRIAAVYIACAFAGAAAGSALGTAAFHAAGWPAVCAVGVTVSLATLVVMRLETR